MKERYYLIIVVDSIDFTWAQTSTTRSEPEDLLHEFITATGIRVSSIRVDGDGEFKKSASFTAYFKARDINIEEVPAYTHTFNARAEGAIRICKEKVRALLRRANMPRRFWPDALLHWLWTYAHWPDKAGHAAWEKLDELGSHALCHDLERDRHVFGSYAQGIFRVSIRMWSTLLTMIERRRAFISGTISLLLLFGCGVFAIAKPCA